MIRQDADRVAKEILHKYFFAADNYPEVRKELALALFLAYEQGRTAGHQQAMTYNSERHKGGFHG